MCCARRKTSVMNNNAGIMGGLCSYSLWQSFGHCELDNTGDLATAAGAFHEYSSHYSTAQQKTSPQQTLAAKYTSYMNSIESLAINATSVLLITGVAIDTHRHIHCTQVTA